MRAASRGFRTALAHSRAATRPLASIRSAHTDSTPPPNSNTASASSGSTTHFGFRTIPEESKEDLVRGVFNTVASNYDLMNDAMSLGVHRLWKDSLISLLRPGSRGPVRCIDVAGGTGDIALRILDHARETYGDRETRVDVVDINGEMLKEGQKRFKKTMYHNTPQIAFLEANAQALHAEMFPDNTYDVYTIAFGIRNVTSIPDVLREAHRVLKPGGTFACLEFNKVTNPVLAQYVPPSSLPPRSASDRQQRRLYDQYSFSVIPLLGTILAGDRASYQYLVESIRRFPSQGDFAQMIADAGFATGGNFEGDGGGWRDLWGGIACIHTGVKL
ncbi:ubiquinone menaquinone biosynthesis methyltransferase UbiE [Lactarius psammicola]|nr:ubiquinone menaquinone biosynthesis methyltransferase UbiE [Lactarius psammicola]